MKKRIRIGTRDSQLAVWQATLVQQLLKQNGHDSELIYIKSEGDIDLQTPLYELGVQGIFTRSLDTALLQNRIDLAVHSMKDVPTKLAIGITPAAILKRASYKDLLVYKEDPSFLNDRNAEGIIATSSVRRRAQWLHRYPGFVIENLRGNVNTRLRKLEESNWSGAIFAAAGLERIDLRPESSVELDWMLPAPSQGAIIIVCRKEDDACRQACLPLNDADTALCTTIEKDFLRTLMGGCSTPVSALAEISQGKVVVRGNICSLDGSALVEVEKIYTLEEAADAGASAAFELLENGGAAIAEKIRNQGVAQ
ncbi:MAG: hydroxymethylbilane synthase [Chitinophagaceae bacterium]|nr:hydroxymethylbilane synthase [Chitinophagaceae bacterium]